MKAHNETGRGSTAVTQFHPVTGEVVNQFAVYQPSYSDVLRFNSTNGDRRSPNSFDYVAERYDYPTGTEVTRNSSNKVIEERQGNLGQLFNLEEIEIPNLETSMYNSALSRLNEKARGSMDLSTSVLEYRQVLRMLNGAGSIRSYLGNTIRAATKKGRSPRGETTVKGLVRDAGGNWLQWKLGLAPLLADFQSAVKEVSTGVTLRLMRIKASASDPIVISALGNDVYDKISSTKISGKQGVSFHVQFRPTDQFDALRWASLNPIGWAWELIPLSFVLDWVYDVGGFIRDAETALAYNHTFDSGYVTYLRAVNGSVVTDGTLVIQGEGHRITCVSRMRYISFRRRVLGSWPFPRAPAFSAKLGSSQLLTSAALLAQLLKK